MDKTFIEKMVSFYLVVMFVDAFKCIFYCLMLA
jgi:hypothetical protein